MIQLVKKKPYEPLHIS